MPEDRVEHLLTVDVPPGQEPGLRLDVYLTNKLPNVSRSKVQKGIEAGRVTVSGEVVTKNSHGVQPGDHIVCRVMKPPPIEVVPEEIPLDILYEDDWLIVVNKPAGMVVHPAYGHRSGTLVNALLHHVGGSRVTAEQIDEDAVDDDDLGLSTIGAGPQYEGDRTLRPGLVHRLDKDTTGVMVAAKRDAAHAPLAEQFAERTIGRRYLALVWGIPEPPSGTVESDLGRSPRDRKRVAVLKDGAGKRAITHYETVEAFEHLTLVRFRLETGRTHQIRVHAQHLGHPVFGDLTYGGDRIVYGSAVGSRKKFIGNLLRALPRQALHAHTLGFTHPETGEEMHFEAPLPSDMEHVLSRIRKVEGGLGGPRATVGLARNREAAP